MLRFVIYACAVVSVACAAPLATNIINSLNENDQIVIAVKSASETSAKVQHKSDTDNRFVIEIEESKNTVSEDLYIPSGSKFEEMIVSNATQEEKNPSSPEKHKRNRRSLMRNGHNCPKGYRRAQGVCKNILSNVTQEEKNPSGPEKKKRNHRSFMTNGRNCPKGYKRVQGFCKKLLSNVTQEEKNPSGPEKKKRNRRSFMSNGRNCSKGYRRVQGVCKKLLPKLTQEDKNASGPEKNRNRRSLVGNGRNCSNGCKRVRGVCVKFIIHKQKFKRCDHGHHKHMKPQTDRSISIPLF